MSGALHPTFLAAGLLLGALAWAVGRRWRRARAAAVAVAAAASAVVLVAATGSPPKVVLLPPVGALLGALVGAAIGTVLDRSADTTGGWALSAGAVVAAGVYLSVADTEGPVLVGAMAIALATAWTVSRWRAPVVEVGAAAGALAAAAVAAGAGSSWTPGGWLGAKVALVIVYAGAAATAAVRAARRRRSGLTSGPARPPQ